MDLFLSIYFNRLDKKGRISVPASYRATLSQEGYSGFIAFRSYKFPAIECCSFSRMEQMSKSVDQLDIFSEAQDDFSAAIFADAEQIPFDGDGRIILPKDLVTFAEIEGTAAFVGRGATFQIWRPDRFEAHQNKARERIHERQATLKLAPGSLREER